jgi:hypothetical protein
VIRSSDDQRVTMLDALIGVYTDESSSLMLLNVGYAPAGGGDAYGEAAIWKPIRIE